MDQTAEALGEFLAAVDGKVRELKATRDDVLMVADDSVRATLRGEKLYSPTQQAYHQQFKKFLQDPAGEKVRMSECANDLARKDVTLASLPGGGYGLPRSTAGLVNSYALPGCPLLDDTVLGLTQVTTTDVHYPVGRADDTIVRVSETASRLPTATESFSDRVLSFGTYQTFCTVSEFAAQDLPDIEGYVTRRWGAQLAQQLMADALVGDGNGKLLGMLATAPATTADFASPMRNNSALQYTFMAGASLALGDLNGLYAAFNEHYLQAPDFHWLMRPSTWKTVFALDTTGTAILLMPRTNIPGYNVAGNLCGLPVCLSSNMPAATTNLFPIVAGSWKAGFVLAERGPRTVTVDTVTVPGLRKYYMRSRFGSAVLSNTALKCLKWATS